MESKNSGWLVLLVIIGFIWFTSQNPPTPPVTQGPRTVLLWYETSEVTPQFNLEITELRAGEPSKYLQEKKHNLLILDVNQTLSPKDPAEKAVYEKAKEIGPPAIVVGDSSKGSVIYAGKFEMTTTAEKIVEFIKTQGG